MKWQERKKAKKLLSKKSLIFFVFSLFFLSSVRFGESCSRTS